MANDIGYALAVRASHTIAITGTVGINADGTFRKTAAEQTRRALAIIRTAIEALGGGSRTSSARACS